MRHLTEEALNEQVQSLTKQGKFQTAVDVIANYAYWDIVERYNEEPTPQGEDMGAPADLEFSPVTEEDLDEIESLLPPGLMRDKIIGEFGVRWGNGEEVPDDA